MDITSLNISLPVNLKEYLEEQTEQGGYASVSEYMRELVRADQKRKAEERVVALLMEGLNSGEPIEVTPEFWKEQRERLEQYVAARTKK